MTDLTKYIEINHHLMTVKEMSEERGVGENYIRRICSKNNWVVMSPADRTRDYIKAHPGAILEDVADKFGTDAGYIRELAKGIGITLVTRFQAEGKKEPPKPKKKQDIRYSLMHHAFKDADRDNQREQREILIGSDKPVKRVREAYTQGGSPYKIADEVWNRNLK